jgi:DNA-binding response OmpR family regulator
VATVRQKGEGLTHSSLRNRRVLVVEDEFFIALDLEMALQAAQAIVLGPVGRVRDGLELVAREPEIGGAILDVNVGGEMVFPVADALLERSVPFLFVTGERPDTIPTRFAGVSVYQKPTASLDLVQCVADLLV